MEEIDKKVDKQKFDRELMTLSEDGGTVGIDWDGGIPDPNAADKKPFLILMPGLGGSSTNLYTINLLKEARKEGYKCGTVLFRGADGIPITTPKLSCAACWKDAEFICEYVRNKYAKNAVTGKNDTRVYAFGASLGAVLLGLYLANAGEKAKSILDGALLYCNAWNADRCNNYFYASGYGLYQRVIGMALNNKILVDQIPKLQKLMPQEEFEALRRVF